MTKDLIPAGALNRHIAILGANGSGKTSAAKVAIVETALHAGERIIVIDPTGVWWGLRLGRNGRSKAFSIYIFGGEHGDYPLRARDAAMLAEAFGTSSDSAVFDTSQMTVSERTAFFTEFAEAIRRKNKGPLKLIIDEAHLFMPQAGAQFGGATPAMLHAGNNLVSLGRSKGLRITLISQRPAKLHKDSLSQAHSLVAMRLMAPQDRKAIADWVADQADPETGKEIIASLPSLKPGEGWVWAPQDNVLERKKFPLPTTFDSSRAPEIGDGTGPTLPPLNLDALKGKLTKLEEERKANDPASLKAEIIRLRQQIEDQRNEPRIDNGAIQKAERRGYITGHAAAQSEFTTALLALRANIVGQFDQAVRHLDMTQEKLPLPSPATVKAVPPRVRQTPVEAPRRSPSPATGGDGPIPKGEKACLITIAQHSGGVTRQQLTVITGYKRSTRDAYIQRLKERGYVDQDGERVLATADGVAALGSDYEPLPTGEALRQRVLRELPEGESRILSMLCSLYPENVSRDELTDGTGYKRSTRDAYLQRLAARELITTPSGAARASDHLFT